MALRADDVQYGPWTAGVQYDRAAEDVEDDGLSGMGNMRINAAGAVETRKGTVPYKGEAPVINKSVLACGEFIDTPSTKVVFMVRGTRLYQYSSNDWTDRTDVSGGEIITHADANTFEWANCNGVLILTNGVNPPIKWDPGADAVAADIDSRFTNCSHVAYWENRVWYANTNANSDRLWYSDIGDINTIQSTSFYNIGLPITGLMATQNALTVHTNEGIHTLVPTGNTSIPYQLQRRTDIGTISGRTIVVLPGNRQLFLRHDGIYMWSGGDETEKKSYSLDLGYWPNLDAANVGSKCFGLYFPRLNEAWFWLPYPSTPGGTQSAMNHIMVYSDRFDIWYGPYTGSDTFFTRNCAALIDERPHAGTLQGSGNVYGQLENHDPISTDANSDGTTKVHYSDDNKGTSGTAIRQYFKTGATAPAGSGNTVRWRNVRVYYDSTSPPHDVEAELTVNYEQESGGVAGLTGAFDVNGGGFTLDVSSLNQGALASLRMLYQDLDLSEYDPHTSIRFSNNTRNQAFRIRRCHPAYTDIGRKRKARAGI